MGTKITPMFGLVPSTYKNDLSRHKVDREVRRFFRSNHYGGYLAASMLTSHLVARNPLYRRFLMEMLLDVGCGPGHFLYYARREGWDCYGIDISWHLIHFAKSVYGLRVLNTYMEGLPFKDDCFAVVTINGFLEHAIDPSSVLKAVHRCIMNGGILSVYTPNLSSWMHFLMRKRFPFIMPPEHLWYFSPKSLSLLLEKAGFRVIRINSRELIKPDAAIRGIFVLFGREAMKISQNSVAKGMAVLALACTFPLRFFMAP